MYIPITRVAVASLRYPASAGRIECRALALYIVKFELLWTCNARRRRVEGSGIRASMAFAAVSLDKNGPTAAGAAHR